MIVLGQRFVFDKLLPLLPVELRGWVSYYQLESLFYDGQLPRTAKCPLASWQSAGSILVSRREQKAFRHGSDSALTAEMFRGWFVP